jgi:hypothetical protein
LSFPPNQTFLLLTMTLIFSCRIQYLPLEPGQLLTMQYAQSQH